MLAENVGTEFVLVVVAALIPVEYEVLNGFADSRFSGISESN